MFVDREYNEYRLAQRIGHVRVAIFSFFIFLMLSSIYDVFAITQNQNALIILRFAVLLPLYILLFLSTWVEKVAKYYQLLISLVFTLTSVILIIFIMLFPDAYHFYAIFGVTIIVFVLFFEMNVIYSLVSSMISIGVYQYSVSYYLFEENETAGLITLIYFVLAFLVLLSNYRNELHFYATYKTETNFERRNLDLESEIANALTEVDTTQRITIESLASLAESKDKNTSDHLERVGFLCKSIAEALPVSYYYDEKYTKNEYAKNIELASLLHDIGKIGVSPSILYKPGPLTDGERKKMEKHTVIGYDTLRRIHKKFPGNKLIDMGIEIARSHHENWDGSGYPDSISKYDIPLSARIVAIVDVFDALVSKRPYKDEFSFQETVGIMKGLRNTKFDPKLLDYFMKVINRKSVKYKIKL